MLLLFVLIAAQQSWAQGQTILTVSEDDNLLRTIDPVTGSTASSVAITDAAAVLTFTAAHGLALDPTSGNLFALMATGTQGDCSLRQLVRVNPATGSATVIGPVDDAGASGILFSGLAFDAAGTLYAVSGGGGGQCAFPNQESLFTVDTATGIATLVVALGNGGSGESIAFRASDGLLYHISGQTANADLIFETVDPANPLNAPVNIPITGPDAPDVSGAITHWAGDFFCGRDSKATCSLSMRMAVRASWLPWTTM
jgi:hypothetical protein